jgi:integrase
MLCTILATGLRPAELVRLTVADCLSWDGEIRKEIKVRAEVSLSGKQRTVYFVARRQVLALEAYLVQRAPPREQTQGVGFRGLPPGEVLFVGDQGQGFKVLPRPGGGVPISPRAFEVVAQIFADAGWPSMTCSRVRRELRKRLMDRHARQEEIAAMLDCSPGRQVVRRRPALRSVAAATMDVL